MNVLCSFYFGVTICYLVKMLEGCIHALLAVGLVDSWALWKLARLYDRTPSCNTHRDSKRQARKQQDNDHKMRIMLLFACLNKFLLRMSSYRRRYPN